MSRMVCKCCENRDQSYFIHDTVRDSWVCTRCGCVNDGWFDDQTCHLPFERQVGTTGVSREDREVNDHFFQLMTRMFPDEERDRRRRKRISEICFKVDAPGVVKNRAVLLYEEHKNELKRIRPVNKMLLGCVIVASRGSMGCFIPMSIFRNMYENEMRGIDKITKEICSVIGLNQKTFTKGSIPYVVSHLCLPFKCEKKLGENFEKMCIIAPSIASETRLGIAACKLLKDEGRKIDIDMVAYLVDCNASGIRTFMEKNNKRQKNKLPSKKLKQEKS